MVAVSDFMNDASPAGLTTRAEAVEVLRSPFSCRPLVRALYSLAGVALMASAFGIWVVSSSADLDTHMLLFKLMVTVVFFIVGLTLSLSSRRRVHPEVHLDSVKKELRVMERDCDGVAHLKTALPFGAMQDIDFRDGMLTATGHDGRVLLELPMGMIDNLDQIEAALGASFDRAD